MLLRNLFEFVENLLDLVVTESPVERNTFCACDRARRFMRLPLLRSLLDSCVYQIIQRSVKGRQPLKESWYAPRRYKVCCEA